MTEAEKRAASLLVQICLQKGYLISVYDGGEWVVMSSSNLEEIVDALGTTSENTVAIRAKDPGSMARNHLGWFALIFGNAPDELVSDHLASDACEEIWQEWQNQLNKQEAAQ